MTGNSTNTWCCYIRRYVGFEDEMRRVDIGGGTAAEEQDAQDGICTAPCCPLNGGTKREAETEVPWPYT